MKAQVSVEFMVFMSILILIFIPLLSSSISLQQETKNIRLETEAGKLSDAIAFEINLATKAGDGYERKFYVEESFAGISNFNISVEDYRVTIEWSERSASSPIVTKNVTGTIKKGWNLIKNKNGDVYAN